MIIFTILESGIDVGQEINIGPGKFDKKNKHKKINVKLKDICSPWKKL